MSPGPFMSIAAERSASIRRVDAARRVCFDVAHPGIETAVEDSMNRRSGLRLGRAAFLSVVVGLVAYSQQALVPQPSSQPKTSVRGASSAVQPREARLPPTGLSGYVPPNPQPVPVPYLIGHTLDEARQLVPESSGLILEQPRYIPSNAPAGTVIRQYPEAKSLVKRGTEVSIYVSQGQPATPQPRPTPVTVPNVVGLKQDVAEEKIRFAGLAVATVKQQEWNGAPLTVLSQDPLAEVRVAADTPVNLVVSREVPRTVTLTSLETSATPGEPVHFKVTLSPPADGAQFQFDFGDGQRSDPSPDAYTSHAYTNDGNWPARATVEVNDLSLPSNEVTIPVHAVKFRVTLTPSTLHARVGGPINFHASIVPSPEVVTYAFDFNDGTTQSASPNPDVSHTYTKPGTFLDRVRAIVSVPGALSPDSHNFSSPQVRVVIDPAPPPPPPPPNYWLWEAIAVVLGGLGALGLRSVIRGNQRAPRGRAPAITVVVPSGTFTVKSNGRLWSRIERINGE